MYRYRIGQIVLTGTLSNYSGIIFGKIMGCCEDFVYGTMYWVRDVRDKTEYYTIPENLILEGYGDQPDMDEWCKVHLDEINHIFGFDVSNHVLMVYDTKSELFADGFGEFYCKSAKRVSDKIVLIIA